MAQRTPGHADLRTWVDVDPTTRRAALREALGITPSAVSQLLADEPRFTPDDVHRPAIEVLTGIPRDRWRLPEEVERERASIQRAAGLLAKVAPPEAP